MQKHVNKSCRSRQELSTVYFFANVGLDTAENEPLNVWRKFGKMDLNCEARGRCWCASLSTRRGGCCPWRRASQARRRRPGRPRRRWFFCWGSDGRPPSSAGWTDCQLPSGGSRAVQPMFVFVNFWLILGKLWEARSPRLYRRRFFQVNDTKYSSKYSWRD